MFASAAALTFPPLMEPPMRMTSSTSGTMEGSFWIASAMLVRGPTGTRVISCGAAWTSSMIRSGPKRASTLHLLGGGVAGDDGDGADVQLRRVERQHEGHGVIGAGIGVKNDFLAGGGGRRNKNHGDKKQEEEESGVAGCSGQTAYRCVTSSGARMRKRPSLFGRFPIGH